MLLNQLLRVRISGDSGAHDLFESIQFNARESSPWEQKLKDRTIKSILKLLKSDSRLLF